MKRRKLCFFLLWQAVYPLCLLMGHLSGREFRLAHEGVSLLFAAGSGLFAWLSWREEEQSRWALAAPVLAMVHCVCVLFSVIRWTAGLAGAGILLSGWVVFYRAPKGLARTLTQIPAWLLTLTLLPLIPFCLLFGSIGSVETVQQAVSPDGRYEASVFSLDQGALGGDTKVEVIDRERTVNILIGSFTSARTVYRGDWYDWMEMELSWVDSQTLSINGTDFDITGEKAEILTEIARELDASLSGGIVLEYWDTHGGFHGDGEIFAMIRGTCRFSEDPYWHRLPLSDNVAAALKACLGEEQIPAADKGWYYFRDRHPEALDRGDDSRLNSRASRNFTVAVYDGETDILYYYEYDS